MRRCVRCILPEGYPGISFREDGVCCYCIADALMADRKAKVREHLRLEFERAIVDAKRTAPQYDCLLCYSGGKDSTFLLHLLKTKYDLNVLAYTVDNGFISPRALHNAGLVVSALGVDHFVFRPRADFMKRVYRETLLNKDLLSRDLLPYSNQCCMSCIAIVIAGGLRLGREKKIPLVCIGFTPGQAMEVGVESFMKTGSTMFFADQVNRDDPIDFPKMIRDPLFELVGDDVDDYLIKSQYLEPGESWPRVLYPFHAMVEYDENEILATIAQYGWTRPGDTDGCSTNCRLNSVAIAAHERHHGYHPYISEMSAMVRDGRLSKEEALLREKQRASLPVINDVLERLGLQPEQVLPEPKR